MSEVVYGRVSPALKRALQARAGEGGRSLNATAVELLERGLAAEAEEGPRVELEAALAACARELDEARARLEADELRLALANEREQQTQGTLRALAQRAGQELGQCPRCRKPVRGFDYLVHGRCPHCNKALTALLTPGRRSVHPRATSTWRSWARSAASSVWPGPAPSTLSADRGWVCRDLAEARH